MGGHQVGVHLVLGVAVAVVDDGEDLVALVAAHDRVRRPVAVVAAFIDVVAGVDDEVVVLLGGAAIGGEVAALIVVAADDAVADRIDRSAQHRRRLGAAGRADFVAGDKAVEI